MLWIVPTHPKNEHQKLLKYKDKIKSFLRVKILYVNTLKDYVTLPHKKVLSYK